MVWFVIVRGDDRVYLNIFSYGLFWVWIVLVSKWDLFVCNFDLFVLILVFEG